MAESDAFSPTPDEIVPSEPTTTEAATLAATELSLDEINEAISAFIRNGAIQSYTINGRTVMRASLDSLVKWRDRLLSERAAASGGAVNVFRRGSY